MLGLSWLTFVQRPPAPLMDGILRNARARYAALHEGDVFQLGHTDSTSPGKWIRADKGRLSALAAALAALRQPPWRATFHVQGDTWWYLAVRDNYAIMQDGDVAGSRQEVDQARRRHDVYEGWSDYSGDADALIAMIAEAGKERAVLVSANARPARTLSFVAIGILLASAAAYWGYRHWEEVRLNADLRRATQTLAKPAHAIAHDATKPKRAVGVTAVPLPVFVKTCVPGLESLPMERLGWLLHSADCDARGLQSIWSRGEFAEDASKALGPRVQYGPGGLVSLMTPLAMRAQTLPRTAGHEDWFAGLASFARANGMTLQPDDGNLTPIGVGMSQWRMDGLMAPSQVIPELSQRADVALVRLSWSRSQGWSYTIVFPPPSLSLPGLNAGVSRAE